MADYRGLNTLKTRAIGALLGACVVAMPAALALPTGWQVVEGSVSFDQQGDVLNITSTTNTAVINYITFNVGSGETINFIMPNAGASILNRVIGGNISNIAGSINANGRLGIVNTAGIQVANTAQIQAAALLATTLNISNQDFFSNTMQLVKEGNGASIINEGEINIAEGGYALIAASGIVNTGNIIAEDGTIHLAVGDTVTFHLSNNSSVEVTVDEGIQEVLTGLNAAIQNDGQLTAHSIELRTELAENVFANAINNTGNIEAVAMTDEAGYIAIVGTGGEASINNSGTLVATGDGQQVGGEIRILGDHIDHSGGAVLDVSGGAGGGTILVGGDYQGQGNVYRATTNMTDNTVTIKADAYTDGDGGTIIFWSDDTTGFSGNLFARGGSISGDGGFIEVSGKLSAGYGGMANTLATNGEHGMLLLDPTDITIRDGSGTDTSTTYYEDNLEAQSSNITLSATDDITMNNLSDNVLDITTAGVGITLTAGSGNNNRFSMNTGDTIRTNGGDINISAGDIRPMGTLDTRGSSGTATGGDVTLTGGTDGDVSLASANIGGDLSITTSSGYDIDVDNTTVVGDVDLQAGGGNADITGTGNTFMGDTNIDTNDDNGGDINFSADFQGNVTLYGDLVQVTDTSGDITVTDIHAASTNSQINATGAGSNADVATSWVVDGAGTLLVTANNDVTLRRTGGYTTTLDRIVLTSNNGGDITVDDFQLQDSSLEINARTGGAAGGTAGIWMMTNGGDINILNVRVDGDVDIQTNNGNVVLGSTGNEVDFNGTTDFSAGTADVTGVGDFNGAVGGTAGRIGLEASSGNFTSGGLTASGNTGWNGDNTLQILSSGDIGGTGYTTTGNGDISLQAGDAIDINAVDANQNAFFYAFASDGGEAIRVDGGSSVAGYVVATGYDGSNNITGTNGNIILNFNSGNLTTATAWAGSGDNITLTASGTGGNILQSEAGYNALWGASTFNGKTIFTTGGGDVVLTASGGANSYINTGVNALGSGANITARANGESGGGLSVQLYGRADGNLAVYNSSGSSNAVTGDVNLGTDIGDPNDLNDVYTVMDVFGNTTVRAFGDVGLYGSFWGTVSLYNTNSITGIVDKGSLNIATATATNSIDLTSLLGNITGSNVTGDDITLQAGSSFPRDKMSYINISSLSASGNLDAVVTGSTDGTTSGNSIVITGSVGGSSSGSHLVDDVYLGGVSIP